MSWAPLKELLYTGEYHAAVTKKKLDLCLHCCGQMYGTHSWAHFGKNKTVIMHGTHRENPHVADLLSSIGFL